jgi:hypothetical protein
VQRCAKISRASAPWAPPGGSTSVVWYFDSAGFAAASSGLEQAAPATSNIRTIAMKRERIVVAIEQLRYRPVGRRRRNACADLIAVKTRTHDLPACSR